MYNSIILEKNASKNDKRKNVSVNIKKKKKKKKKKIINTLINMIYLYLY